MSPFVARALAYGPLLLVIACAGGSKPSSTLVKPLTPAQVKAFDNGVDFVATLEGIEARWRDDGAQDLQERVASSSLIAAVTVSATRTDTDPSQRVTYRLVAHVDRELVGQDPDKEVELPVGPEDPGYNSVKDNITRIADKQYVAYVRTSPAGLVWHLAPASPEVVSETEGKITQLNRAPKA